MIWFVPEALAVQTRFRLLSLSDTTCPSDAEPVSLETFCAAENVVPLSFDCVKKIWDLPGVVSSQLTLILPAASRFSHGAVELPKLLERFSGEEKLTPPSIDRTN